MQEIKASRFPGIPSIIDGSEAVAYIETRISEGCCAYPITPSTTMATLFEAAVADGKKNLWGTPLTFLELESEHSSASAAEGFALAGGRVTNFTAGPGTQTIPLWIFSAIQRPNALPVVNVVALILVLVSTIPVYFAQRISGDAGAGGRY